MSPTFIVSYDGTDNDRDALALGRVLRDAGGTGGLAYVRHARAGDPVQEILEGRRAAKLLERAADVVGAPPADQHVIVHASTGEGLRELVARRGTDIVVFGSDYRTAPGTVRSGTSAQRLLNGGPAAVAVAPAGFRDRSSAIHRIGVLDEAADGAAADTAAALAHALGAAVTGPGEPADLLVVGSRAEARVGRVALSAVAEYAIETSAVPVIVVPRAAAVHFPAPTLTAA
jgi:nucleotide-binding universal stress UspA family protein